MAGKRLETLRSNPRRALAPASLLAGSVGLAAPGVAAGKPAICSNTFDPYQVSNAISAVCGIKSFPLQQKVAHPDGSADYVYVVDGHTVDWRYPGPGFDPVTATPAQRRYFRLPPEPARRFQRIHALWERLIRRLHFVHPPARLVQGKVKHEPAHFAAANRATGTNDVYLTTNWSGQIATGNFTTASSSWFEPAPKATSCPGNSASFWSGLGGVNSYRLAQNGTDINIPGEAQHQAWWEILPAYSVDVPLTGHAGYQFFTGVWRNPGSFTFEFYDDYSAGYLALDVSSGSFDGSTAEFIAERPQISGRLTPLTNFGTALWDNALESPNGLPKNLSVEPTHINPAVMVSNDATKLLAAPYAGVDPAHTVGVSGTLTNVPAARGGFNDLWKNCG